MSLEILGGRAAANKSARGCARATLLAALLPWAACAGGDGLEESVPAAGPRPNLLLVVIDTLRRDHLGLYGYGKPTSPGLDAFAQQAVVFDRCLAASSWTEPSTASLLSGLYPTRHGAHEYAMVPPDVVMIAEELQAAGYRTLAVSGNPNASPLFGFEQGFDQFHFSGNEEARDYPDVSELVAKAEEFLGEAAPATGADAPGARPWFLYLHLMNVHGPYHAPPQYRERFLELPWQEFAFQNEVWKEIVRKGAVERRADVTPEHLRDLTARYDGAIAWTDEVLSGFLRRVLDRPDAGRDCIVVTADHGEELFDHGGFGHGFTLFHEVVDVPLLLRRPGGAGGGLRVDAPVSLVDVAPTLLELLGLLPAEGFGDGMSLGPLLTGAAGAGFERTAPLVAQLERDQGQAYLLQQWPLRLIETGHDYAGRKGVTQLFDLAADPKEKSDLFAADAERGARLQALLAARRAGLAAQAFHADASLLDEVQRRRMEKLGYTTGKKGG